MVSVQQDRVISVHRGQEVRYPDSMGDVSATVEQIREIRTARYLDSFTGPGADVVLTLQMSDCIISARGWQVVF